MTSRILFTCNSRISAEEVRFFCLLRKKLQESEYEFVFLSPNEYPGMDSFLVKRPDWGRQTKSFNFTTLPTKKAMQLIDADKWLLRVGYFRGHPHGHEDCLPILELIAGESLAFLNRMEPGMFVAWNSLYPVPGVMYDLAKALGIPAVDSERGMLPGTLQLAAELRGLHNGLCDMSWDAFGPREAHPRWAQAGEAFLKTAYMTDFCRYEVAESSLLDSLQRGRRARQRPRVLVAGAFDLACGISLADPARTEILPGFESGFDIARKVSNSHPGVTIFKPHPAMVGYARYCDTRGANNLLLGFGHPRNYLEWADVVVSYGSLEYDALALEKPVVLVGRSSLFGKGICYEAPTEQQLTAALELACKRENFEDKQKRFKILVGYLIEHQLYRFDTEEMRQQNVERWCNQLRSTSNGRETGHTLDTILKEIQMRPTPRDRAVQALHRMNPLLKRKARGIWNAIKS